MASFCSRVYERALILSSGLASASMVATCNAWQKKREKRSFTTYLRMVRVLTTYYLPTAHPHVVKSRVGNQVEVGRNRSLRGIQSKRIMMVHRLKDIAVVLTGASSGIGASIAEHLLKEGAKVCTIGR